LAATLLRFGVQIEIWRADSWDLACRFLSLRPVCFSRVPRKRSPRP